jgi:hypothetical protein
MKPPQLVAARQRSRAATGFPLFSRGFGCSLSMLAYRPSMMVDRTSVLIHELPLLRHRQVGVQRWIVASRSARA